jgi:regulator of protease activity HflC (stomatin/prohibitin superfamily)
MTVQYRLKPESAPQTIANWGLNWEDKIINPVVRDVVRSVIGGFAAEELPMQRGEISQQIRAELTKQFDSLENQPVQLTSIQLREIVLPEKIKEQIERVQIARQEAERTKLEVERARQEAEKRAALAEGTAQANRIEAQGRADAVTIEAQAQAEANKLIAKSLTDDLLHLEQVKVQGKFNEALQVNKDAKIFLTPGGSTPNLWVDMKSDAKTKTSTNQ